MVNLLDISSYITLAIHINTFMLDILNGVLYYNNLNENVYKK